MPTTHIEPEVAFEVTDQTGGTWSIYHTYHNNDFDQGRNRFWYTTDASEDEELEFDIRSLFFTPCNLDKELTPTQRFGDNSHHLALQMALSRGLVAFNDTGELVFNQTHVRPRHPLRSTT